MSVKVKQSGKKFVNWPEFVPTIRTELNKIREKKLPQDINSYEFPVQEDLKEVIVKSKKSEKPLVQYERIEPKYKVGRYCFVYMDHPKNALGKKQPNPQRRQGDYNWDRVPRRIEKVVTMGGRGPTYRYVLEDLPNVSYTENQLKPAVNPNN